MSKKRGRPRKWDPTKKDIERIEQLAGVLNQTQLADFFGMAPSTFREYAKRDERISVAYKKGRAAALGRVGATLLQQALGGNTVAAIFYLKTQGGWREKGEPERQESAQDHAHRIRAALAEIEETDGE